MAIRRIFKAVEEQLRDNWLRNKQLEENVVFGEPPIYCFKHAPTHVLPGALLWVTEKSPDILYVYNIIPTDVGQLSYDEYNDLLVEFYDKFIKPIAAKSQITAKLTPPEMKLTNLLSKKSYQLFRTFSADANKSTGSAYPSDRKRWFSFIVSMHKKREGLPSNLLEIFLQ